MSSRNLQIAAWIGGIITAVDIAALILPVIVTVGLVDHFGSGGSMIIIVIIVAVVIAGLATAAGTVFAVGFALGLIQGRAGNALFAAFVLCLLVVTLPTSNYGDTAGPWTGVAWAAALIGPSLLGWSLSRLRAGPPIDQKSPV